MNRLLILLLVTASIAASGCTGVPEGTATNGALVTIDWVGRDPGTGEVLAQGSGLRFVVGMGGSGLGEDLERSVRGRAADETYTFVSEDDESRVFTEEVRMPQFLGSDPAEDNATIAVFNDTLGHLPVEGEVFVLNPYYNARVVSVGEEEFTYRFHLAGDEQRDQVAVVGAVLVSRIEDGQLVRTLEPEEGARFTIQPPQPGGATPLGLAPGAYLTVGAEGGDIIYRRAEVRDAALADRPVEFEVTVREVQGLTGGDSTLEEGKYGVRGGSPYVNGDPTGVRPLDHGDVEHDPGQTAEDTHADAHDDGHGDHDH